MQLSIIWIPKSWKIFETEKYLKHDNLLDFSDLDLFSELNIFKVILGLKNDKPINIINYI